MTGELAVMTREDGDFRVTWDSEKPAEVAHARETFDKFKGQGYLAYKVEKGGARGEVLKSFDASAERLIMAPRMMGG